MKVLIAPQPDYRRALSLFERAAKVFPDYYEAYTEMGVAHQHLGEGAEAEKALRKSVEMSASRYPDALFLLSEMLNDEGRLQMARVSRGNAFSRMTLFGAVIWNWRVRWLD